MLKKINNVYYFISLVLYLQCIELIYIILSGTKELPHTAHTIVYNNNAISLKNKPKSNQHILSAMSVEFF